MMKTILVLLDGFEEMEAIIAVDILRRGGVDVETVSLSDQLMVQGKHNIGIQADTLLKDINQRDVERLIIPGGTTEYLNHPEFMQWVAELDQEEKALCAICAAPAVFGTLGIVDGKHATIYPGLESYMQGAILETSAVVVDGRVITARGPAKSFDFAFAVLESIKGKDVCIQLRKDLLLD